MDQFGRDQRMQPELIIHFNSLMLVIKKPQEFVDNHFELECLIIIHLKFHLGYLLRKMHELKMVGLPILKNEVSIMNLGVKMNINIYMNVLKILQLQI